MTARHPLAGLRSAFHDHPRSGKTTGQALVEFALVFPVVLVLIFGLIDLSWMVFSYTQLWNGLREGLRYASVTGFGVTPQYYQCDAIRQQIVGRAGFSGVKASNITVTYDNGEPGHVLGSCPAGGAVSTTSLNTGNRVVVEVNVEVPFLTPFIRALAPQGMAVRLRAARSLYPGGV
jgi:Flp pilus assembly protein TadG